MQSKYSHKKPKIIEVIKVKMEKTFFYDDKRCEGCARKCSFTDKGEREKWFCFGITNPKVIKTQDIPEYDNLRLCIKGSFRKPREKGLFQLNMTTEEARALLKGIESLLP